MLVVPPPLSYMKQNPFKERTQKFGIRKYKNNKYITDDGDDYNEEE